MLRFFKVPYVATPGRRSITSTNLQHPGKISEGTKHTSQLHRPTRGGQDLSNRWRRLERSLRQKISRSSELEAFEEYDASSAETSQHAPLKKDFVKPVSTFHGFQVPEEPKPPADDECCMSGCAVCVYDLYEDSLKAYKEAVASLRTSLSALRIPEEEWPPQIRSKDAASDTGRGPRKDAIMNAFEEMERQLALKHKNDAKVDASNSVDPELWKKRQQLVATKKAELSRSTFLNDTVINGSLRHHQSLRQTGITHAFEQLLQ